MSAHFIDTIVFGDSVGTPAMRAVFEERSMLRRWLEVEAALAQAQAELKMIPAEAARLIAAKADVSAIDLEAVKAHGKKTGHSLLGLLAEFRRVIDHDYARYLHFGATTQDVIDTGLMLMVKEAHGVILAQLGRVMRLVSGLVEGHAGTVMVGRTHGGHGLPITFGFKAASWLSELSRQLERWLSAQERILVGNLTGAVGTFAAWGEEGPAVQARTLAILGLGVPEIVWHSSRDRVAEAASLLALLAGTCARIGREVYNLSKTEVQELMEPSEGKVGSSTMPHKRNPIHSEWIMVLERGVRANASLIVEAMGQENERDASRWKSEWIALPEAFIYLSGCLNHLEVLLRGLKVDAARMLSNTDLLKGMLLSEQVMFLLEKHFPLPLAHQKVYQASVKAADRNTRLVDELLADPEVAGRVSREEIEARLDPAGYLGLAPRTALAVRERVEAQLTSLGL